MLGTFLQLAEPAALEVLARSGHDFAILDLEHGGLTLDGAMGLLRAAAVTSFPLLARLPVSRLALTDQLLDSGAAGILAARVGNVDEAQAVVRAVRYPPHGERGACPGTRANEFGALSWPAHVARAEAEIVVAIALEGGAAIADAGAILDVPGIDVAFVGIFDLAASLGLPGQTDHPTVVGSVTGIVEQSRQRGIAAGTWSPTIDAAREWHRRGVTFLPVSTDIGMWRQACLEASQAWSRTFAPPDPIGAAVTQ